jgi:hypothetical protein
MDHPVHDQIINNLHNYFTQLFYEIIILCVLEQFVNFIIIAII